MLHKSSDKIRHCYERATVCRESALRTNDVDIKASMFAAEDSWIRLAQSYELTETLADFGKEARRYLGLRDD